MPGNSHRSIRRPKEHQEETICQEFVQSLNALGPNTPPTYHYMGLVRELTGEDFPDCKIRNRSTGKELGVELTRLALEWVPAEKTNMEVLERRLAYELRGKGYEQYRINLQTRDYTSHPLSTLSDAFLEDLARTGKRFFEDHRQSIVDRVGVPILVDEIRAQYRPFTDVFQVIILSFPPRGFQGRVDDLSPVVSIGVMAWAYPDLRDRVELALTDKLRGPSYSTDILLIYAEPTATGLDSTTVIEILKRKAEGASVQSRYAQVWYLSPHWQDREKIYRIV